MTYLVAAQTVVLVLLAILVAGLLRSHAEILRRLPDEEEGGAADGAGSDDLPDLKLVSPPEREEDAFPAVDLAGETLEGDAVKVALTAGAPPTLLAFLSSGCLTCANFWDAFRAYRRSPLPGGARLVIVTKDSAYESPSKLDELAPEGVPLVMSSAAWDDYSVPVAPYFVYVGGGHVLGEGAANDWSQIESLFRDALRDLERSEPEAAERPAGDTAGSSSSVSARRPGERLDEEDATLAAAGVRPGDASLYPAEQGDREQE